MKILLIVFALVGSLFAFDMDQKTNLTLLYADYNNYTNEGQLYGDTKLKYQNKSFDINAQIKYLFSTQYSKNSYLKINELYGNKEFTQSKIQLGKVVKYWGELEGYNISDIYNQKDYILDPFEKGDKTGAWGGSFTYYLENNSLEIGTKFYEGNKEYPKSNYPYPISTLNYDKNLQTQSARENPTLYLKYNFLTDENIQSDNKIILYRGYDNKRYFIPINNTTLSQYAYKVNKLLFTSNVVYQDTIFKLESSYTNVIKDRQISDYTQVGFGVENGFYDIKGIDINLYVEYYKYIYQNGAKIKNVDMSEVYDNDMFVALKFQFNDYRSSELKSGILHDMKKDEDLYKIEFKSRIKDGLVFQAQYLQIKSTANTILASLDEHTRTTVSLTYTF